MPSSFNFLDSFSTNCSSSGWHPASSVQVWYSLVGVVAAVSCLFGIPANLSVMVKLGRDLRGSAMSQRLFFSLALSDLLCLLCLLAGGVIFLAELPIGAGVCQAVLYFLFFSITSSSNILVLISVQRYYQILHHTRWAKVSRGWQRLLLGAVWGLAALLALPAALTEAGRRPADGLSCRNQRIPMAVELIYISYAVCCQLLLLLFYLLLVRGLKRIKMCDQKKRAITKLLSRILAVSLVLGFFPITARLFYVYAGLTQSETLLCVSKMLTFIEFIYFFTHCLNPWLYFFTSLRQRRRGDGKRRFLMALNDSS
ncbi:nociceptin receptor-like [Menidia menidia]